MKTLLSFLLFLAGAAVMLLPEVLHDACPYVAEIGLRSPLPVFLSWLGILGGFFLRPSAALVAAFYVLTARGVNTPDHESLSAAVWFLSGLLCLPFGWIARDVEA